MPSATEIQEHRLILITGPSGAGRSTALHALEDLGFEGIDNLPFSLIPRLIDGPALGRPIALGVDVRELPATPDRIFKLVTGG